MAAKLHSPSQVPSGIFGEHGKDWGEAVQARNKMFSFVVSFIFYFYFLIKEHTYK